MSGPAPSFDCSLCRRYMGKRCAHFLLKDRRVVCGRCMDRHHLWGNDQLDGICSRAAVACLLGLWS